MNKLVKELAKLAKVSDVEAFAEALKSETDTNYQLDIDNLVVRTKEEDEAYKSNISKEIKDKAFTDAFEIQIKNMKKDLGLEFEGKRQEDFIESFKSKVLKEASIEPNKRISELENTLNNINKSLQEKDIEINSIKDNFKKEKTRLEAENYIPDLVDTIGLTKQEATDLFFMKYQIKDDGVYKGDERLVSTKTAEPLGLKDVIYNFVSEKGWNKEAPKGRGGEGLKNGKSGILSPTTLDEFNSLAKEKGFNIGSKDYNALLSQVVKENPSIIE